MNPNRWQRLKDLFEAAEECAENERTALLDRVDADDPDIGAQLRALLAHRVLTDDFLEKPAVRIAGRPAMPTTIGRYRIIRMLGEGGMGVVYEAEQQQPRRTVALKVVKPGFAGPELRRRFQQESQALGRLQHPGIAQIYEAGTAETELGPQPYFAMELIRGEGLLEYAETHRYDTRQRLELMAKICEAVHHAHQRGIVHRDLKPANILVEDGGQPKVLDFGVARMTDSDAQFTRQTDLGQIIGTLAYMSPEQVLGDSLAIDTRSDVYTLGIILFELLTGRLPYRRSGNLYDAVDAIREEEPARLSSINRSYRGDIETIAGKALEKEKEHRYSSAAAMAADIRHYLSDEPLSVRSPSSAYYLKKFVRRRKGLVSGVAAVFVVLVAGVIVSTWQARRAETEAATAVAISSFLQNDLLARASANVQSRPGAKPDPDLKVRTVLDRASARIKGKFPRQPLVEASIRQTIGSTYRDLGNYPEAKKHLVRSFDLRRQVLGSEHPDTLESIDSLAVLYQFQGEYAKARPLSEKVVAIRQRVQGMRSADTLFSMNNLALLDQFQGRYSDAESIYRQVVDGDEKVLGKEHPDTLLSMNNLAYVYQAQGKYEQAALLYPVILETRRRVLGNEHPETLRTMHDMAMFYQSEGQHAKAVPIYVEVVKLRRHVLGEEHPDTLMSVGNLAALYQSEGRYTEAEALSSRALEIKKRVLGEEHPDTLATMQNLGVIRRAQGQYPEAEMLLTKTLAAGERAMGAEHPNTQIIAANLALVYGKEHKYAQGEALLTKVVNTEQRTLGAEHPNVTRHMNDLASLYIDDGRFTQAESLLREALGRYEKAKNQTWGKYSAQSLLGASLAGLGKYAEAEPLLLTGRRGMVETKETVSAERRLLLDRSSVWILNLYRAWGKPLKAKEWRNAAAQQASL